MALDPTLQDLWSPARLLPVVGIRSQDEQEKRATSSLLAVMSAVPEFGHAFCSLAGAPKGRISTFAEIHLHDAEGNLSIPDGAIVIERGQRRWRALVEVKTGANPLEADQVDRYLSLAKSHQIDCVITVSNQITAGVDQPPVAVDKRKLKTMSLFHFPWWKVITIAVMQHRYRGVSDPDQAWILNELLAYLTNPNAGAHGFQDMGPEWVRVREAAREGTLRHSDPEALAVSVRWDQLLDFLAMELSQDLGRDVMPLRTKGESHSDRIAATARELGDEGVLRGALKVPDAISNLEVIADLRARQLTTRVSVPAPKEGRPLSRVRWMLHQLREGPDDLRVEVSFPRCRDTTSSLLKDVRDNPEGLLYLPDPKREPRHFTLAVTRPMGLKGGAGQKSFIRETRRQVMDFYEELMQNLKPWQAKAPRLQRDDAYGVEEHLAGKPEELKSLFRALDSYILAFEGSERRVRKQYINYEVREKSFASIEIQKGKMDVCLVLTKKDIEYWDDSWMQDVTAVGHLGNGDTCVFVRSGEQLPRVAALLRQSYETAAA